VSPREIAQSRREAMRLRARRIRQTVAALAVALFSAAFLTVYVQLASGHDPALTAAAKRQTSPTSSTSSRETEARGSETVEASTGEEADTGEGPSSVTSRQS
jgi:hypothetical protein